MLKVDIRVPVGLPVKETAAFIRQCEDAGFSGVGVHDHQHSGRDVYVTLALAAQETSHIRLYPATSNPITRHPMVLASLAHTLEEIAPRRVQLTVGPGFLSVGNIGRRRAGLREMRDAILMIKDLLAGQTVSFGNVRSRLRNVSPSSTPVFMTASGPRLLELAGEIADGVLLLVGLDPKAIEAARRHLERGARTAGRDLEGFPIIFITPLALDEDGLNARRWPQRWMSVGRPWLTYPSKSNLHWLREAGIDLPENVVPESISDDLSDRICDAFGLFGTAQECGERLRRAVVEAGVEHVFIFPSHTVAGGYQMPSRELEAFRDVIFPRFLG